MKSLKPYLLALFCFSVLLMLSNCTSDDGDDPGSDEIDLNDPNAITDAIGITGATVVAGDPPAPSTDPAAPVLQDIDDITTSQGGNPQFSIDFTSGSVAGVYFQIQGADSYYDIPSSAFTGGRVEDDHFSFEIEIPDNLEPGTFCVDYCVYDEEARVSNIVTVCIEVTSFGGEDSDFLIGAWSVISFGDGNDVVVIGQDADVETYTTSLPCSDGTFVDVEVTDSEFFEFITITFSENGGLRFQASYEEEYLDYENSTCENQVYTTEMGSDDVNGAWSYESANNRLVLILDFDDDEGEEALDLTITVDGDRITALQQDQGESQTIILEKQQ